MKKVIVIGGGLGGISTALRLLKKGYKVTIIEKDDKLGGKINRFSENGFKFDLTASILMTPDSYISLFEECEKDYRDYINIVDLFTLYRVDYFDKSGFRLYSDSKRTLKMLEKFRNNLSKGYIEYLEKSIEKYSIVKDVFLDRPMTTVGEIINFETIYKSIKLSPLKNNYEYTKNFINSSRFLEFLMFQSMYVGVNPYKGTNIYSLIPAITQLYGLIYIKGGFYSYIEALEKLLMELGCKIIKNTEVKEIILDDKKVRGVLCDENKYSGDIVVCNADYPYVIENLLKEDVGSINKKDVKNFKYSPSVFIIYLGLSEKLENFEVHNIFINEDLKKEFEEVFENELPSKPSLYIYYPSDVDDSLAPEGKSVMNVMVRVPNMENEKIIWDNDTIREFRNRVIGSMKKIKGLYNIENIIEYEKVLTPKDLKEKFNLYNGSAFGINHKLSQSGYFRPHIKGRGTKGLYFMSTSTHPGNGASVAIDGSKMLAELIEKENPNY